MSNTFYHAVRRRGPSDFGAREVLLLLAAYADDAGRAWPSFSTVAADLALSERAARRILKRLQADGWLRVDARGGGRVSNRYLINRDRLDAPQDGASSGDDGRETPSGDAEWAAQTPPFDSSNATGRGDRESPK